MCGQQLARHGGHLRNYRATSRAGSTATRHRMPAANMSVSPITAAFFGTCAVGNDKRLGRRRRHVTASSSVLHQRPSRRRPASACARRGERYYFGDSAPAAGMSSRWLAIKGLRRGAGPLGGIGIGAFARRNRGANGGRNLNGGHPPASDIAAAKRAHLAVNAPARPAISILSSCRPA